MQPAMLAQEHAAIDGHDLSARVLLQDSLRLFVALAAKGGQQNPILQHQKIRIARRQALALIIERLAKGQRNEREGIARTIAKGAQFFAHFLQRFVMFVIFVLAMDINNCF